MLTVREKERTCGIGTFARLLGSLACVHLKRRKPASQIGRQVLALGSYLTAISQHPCPQAQLPPSTGTVVFGRVHVPQLRKPVPLTGLAEQPASALSFRGCWGSNTCAWLEGI